MIVGLCHVRASLDLFNDFSNGSGPILFSIVQLIRNLRRGFFIAEKNLGSDLILITCRRCRLSSWRRINHCHHKKIVCSFYLSVDFYQTIHYGHISLKVSNFEFDFDVRFSMFDFTSVHLCQKPDIEMDMLGHFGLG